MERVQWVWDPDKAKTNLRKHKIAFTEAVLAFNDPFQLSRLDLNPDGDRWQTIGHVGQFLVLVVHTMPVKLKPDAPPVESSAPASRRPRKGEPMKKESSSPLNQEQHERLKRLAALPDEAIDTSDAPEVMDWSGAKRGLFYSGASIDDEVAVAVDARVVDWFQSNSESDEDFKSRINRVLKEHIAEELRKAS